MRTNSKQVRDQIKSHIMECVTDENENGFNSFEDAANRLYSEFDRVANYKYNMVRIPNNQDRFSDYLLGLPFAFEYTNEGIETYLNSLGINPGNKKFDSDKSLKLYHYLIFSEVAKAIK